MFFVITQLSTSPREGPPPPFLKRVLSNFFALCVLCQLLKPHCHNFLTEDFRIVFSTSVTIIITTLWSSHTFILTLLSEWIICPKFRHSFWSKNFHTSILLVKLILQLWIDEFAHEPAHDKPTTWFHWEGSYPYIFSLREKSMLKSDFLSHSFFTVLYNLILWFIPLDKESYFCGVWSKHSMGCVLRIFTRKMAPWPC